MLFKKSLGKDKELAQALEVKQQQLTQLSEQVSSVEEIIGTTVQWREMQERIGNQLNQQQLILQKQLTTLLHTLSFSPEIREKMHTRQRGVVSALEDIAATTAELEPVIAEMLKAYNHLKDMRLVIKPFPAKYRDLEEKSRVLEQTIEQLAQTLKEYNQSLQVNQSKLRETEQQLMEKDEELAKLIQQADVLEAETTKAQQTFREILDEHAQKLDELGKQHDKRKSLFDGEVFMQNQVLQEMKQEHDVALQEMKDSYSAEENNLKKNILKRTRELEQLERSVEAKQTELDSLNQAIADQMNIQKAQGLRNLEQDYLDTLSKWVNVRGQLEIT